MGIYGKDPKEGSVVKMPTFWRQRKWKVMIGLFKVLGMLENCFHDLVFQIPPSKETQDYILRYKNSLNLFL